MSEKRKNIGRPRNLAAENLIQEAWMALKEQREGTIPPVAVWKTLIGQRGRPSRRKVELFVKELNKGELPPDPPLIPWHSPEWPTNDPEGIACLYRLMHLQHIAFRVGLSRCAAKWALRLREVFSITTAPPEIPSSRIGSTHLVFAKAFCRQERVAVVLGKPLAHPDLDAMLQYRTWEGEANLEVYSAAVAKGLIPGRTVADMVSEFEITNSKALGLARQIAQELEQQGQEAAI